MKQEDTKQRILEKSLELFASKGYDAVSVGEIAKAVGVKAPSLYNHFASKQAIFDAIVESTAAHYEKDTDEISIHVQDVKQDFALFAQQIPSVYLTIGTGEAKDGFCYGNHHPSVRYDESALSVGAAAYAICAQALLENRSAEKKAI